MSSGLSYLPTGTVGAISELLAAVDLMKKGWSVFRSLCPSSEYDLIAEKNDEIFLLEVRTGRYNVGDNAGNKLSYCKAKTDGKLLIVVTIQDHTVHYINFSP